MSSLCGRVVRAFTGANRQSEVRNTARVAGEPGRKGGGGLLLQPGRVHVWIIGVDVEPPELSRYLDVLDGKERARAARLRTTQMRLRFIAAHGAVRFILGRYVDLPPHAIQLQETADGKPFIPNVPLAFNMSHSGELALCAVTRDGRIGVDVERITRLADADQLVKRFFAPGEADQYASAPAADRTAIFFTTWTRKEAFLKAIGSGSLLGRAPLNMEDADAGLHGFSVRSFTPQPGYAAAVALDRPIDVLELVYWPGGNGERSS